MSLLTSGILAGGMVAWSPDGILKEKITTSQGVAWLAGVTVYTCMKSHIARGQHR